MGGKGERKTDIYGEEGEKGERKVDVKEWRVVIGEADFLFDGRYSNPIRGFSAKELQKAIDNYH